MSESFREQRPLLSEDLSEEERFPEYPRRFRSTNRGRAKNSAKGATAIITRWPEHWSSTFTFWWMTLCMMALTIFVIYNIIIAFVLLPTVHMKPTRPRTSNNLDLKTTHLPEIFVHLFINSDDEADLNKYLPYIEIISDKHLNYNFNLILLFNDTVHEAVTHSAEENNEVALNFLWSKDSLLYVDNLNSRKNIRIRQVALSQFMDESPLKKTWRQAPSHFIKFLVRAVSIWDKGGVAINPEILMPRSPNILYIQKLKQILKKYENYKENMLKEQTSKKYANKNNFKKRVNNIRDIINILEREDNHNIEQENLTEAENSNSPVILQSRQKLLSTTIQTPRNNSETRTAIIELPKIPLFPKINETRSLDNNPYHSINMRSLEKKDAIENVHESFEISDDNNETSFNFLPLILELLFHEKPRKPKNNKESFDNNLIRHRKSVIPKEKSERNTTAPPTNWIYKVQNKAIEKDDHTIFSNKAIVSGKHLSITDPKSIENVCDDIDELTIDLKGHIIATKATCHAFIGTMFSNFVHHLPEETLQDFIIAELSLFCKGLLSSCKGINVILL